MANFEREESRPVPAQYCMVDMELAPPRQEQGLLVMLVLPLIPMYYNRLDSLGVKLGRLRMRVEALSGVALLLVRGLRQLVISFAQGRRAVGSAEVETMSVKWHWDSRDVEGPLHPEAAEEESLGSVVAVVVVLEVVVGRDPSSPPVWNPFRYYAANLL